MSEKKQPKGYVEGYHVMKVNGTSEESVPLSEQEKRDASVKLAHTVTDIQQKEADKKEYVASINADIKHLLKTQQELGQMVREGYTRKIVSINKFYDPKRKCIITALAEDGRVLQEEPAPEGFILPLPIEPGKEGEAKEPKQDAGSGKPAEPSESKPAGKKPPKAKKTP